MEAQLDDDLVAELIAAGADVPAAGKRVSEWSTEVDMIATLIDRVEVLIATTVAAAGRPPPTVQPYPRPRTAVDRARDAMRWSRHHQLVARILPAPDGGEQT